MTIEDATRKVSDRFPNSQFRITVVEEWGRRRKKHKKSFVSIAVFGNVVEEAPTLAEAVELICDWVEGR